MSINKSIILSIIAVMALLTGCNRYDRVLEDVYDKDLGQSGWHPYRLTRL